MKNKLRKVGTITVVSLTIIFGVGAIFYSRTDLGEAAGAYDKNRTAAQIAGFFFDLESARSEQKFLQSDNAAALVTEASDFIKAKGIKTFSLKTPDSEIVSYWESLKPGYQKLVEASRKSHLVLPGEPKVDDERLPFQRLKLWLIPMVRRAEITSSKNDFEETKELLKTAVRLSNLVDDEPLLVTALIRVNCLSIIVFSLTQIQKQHIHDPRWQNLILEVLNELDRPPHFASIFKTEHYVSLHIARALCGDEFDPDPYFSKIDRKILFARQVPRFKAATYSRIHQLYLEYLVTCQNAPIDYHKLKADWTRLEQIHTQNRMSMWVASTVVINFSDLLKGFHSKSVRFNLIRQAAEIIRTKHDPNLGLPLQGTFAIDIDGKPLRIKKDAFSWKIYSIGPDGVDDGGLEIEKKAGKNFDIVIRIPTSSL